MEHTLSDPDAMCFLRSIEPELQSCMFSLTDPVVSLQPGDLFRLHIISAIVDHASQNQKLRCETISVQYSVSGDFYFFRYIFKITIGCIV